MLSIVALVFGVLAFGPQVVRSANFTFQLSQVEQCEPVSITYVGDADMATIPMSLILLPFNSHPVSIPIPNAAANTSTVYVTFFPFAAGTTFLASLEDATGENSAPVSDVIRVLPSPSGNATCLPSVEDTTAPRYSLGTQSLSQCEEFSVTYDQTVVTQPPSVRLFSPRGPSFLLNQTANEPDSASAKYLMNFSRNKEIVLLFDDGLKHRETTSLLTVAGDSSSSAQCLLRGGNQNMGASTSMPSSSSGIPKAVIIGGAIGGGAVFVISICMVLFIMRERRRKRRAGIELDPVLLEKGPALDERCSPSPRPDGVDASDGFVKDPPYTAEKFLSPASSVYRRMSMASWAQDIPEDQKYPASHKGVEEYGGHEPHDRLSLNSLDIEGILNMAAISSNRSSRQTVEPAPLHPTDARSPGHVPPPQLVVTRPYPARGHLRDPSDIPTDPSSIALSSYSDNPFGDDSITRSASGVRPSYDHYRSQNLLIRPPPGAMVGLPSSPRSGLRSSRGGLLGDDGAGRVGSRITTDNMGDWYGFAR